MSVPRGAQRDIAVFRRAYRDALPLLQADASALSTLPTAAFQFCEPVRSASAYGWYVFPPKDIVLRWDGSDVFTKDGDDWIELTSRNLDADFLSYWDEQAPDDLKGRAPPFLTSLFIPGVVQIWSGFLASTAPGWSLMVGPLTNIVQSNSFSCYQAMVETDVYKPWPMFINIKLIATDREIVLPKVKPLFQVRPIEKSSYAPEALQYHERIGLEPAEVSGGMSGKEWDGYRRTVRSVLFDRTEDEHDPGSYGATVRRKRKRQSDKQE